LYDTCPIQAKPPPTRKYELIGDDPDLFRDVDEKVSIF
jgi:hypothetical protein